MSSSDLNSSTFGPDKPPRLRPFGGDKPPSTKFSEKIREFLASKEDEYNDLHEAVATFRTACSSQNPDKDCFPKEYLWELPIRNIAWDKVGDISESRDEFARFFLLGQSLAASLTQEKHGGELRIRSTHKNSNFSIDKKIPNTSELTKPRIERPATAEMKAQSGLELLFLYLQIDDTFEESIDWGRLDDMMEAVSLALPSVIYRAKGLCQNDRPYPPSFGTEKPTLKTPEHSSWPGGHAFEVGAMATLFYYVFSRLMDDQQKTKLKDGLQKAASRISYNRERAGLHWRQDGVDGLSMGGLLMDWWLGLGENSSNGEAGVGGMGDFLPLLKAVTKPFPRNDK